MDDSFGDQIEIRRWLINFGIKGVKVFAAKKEGIRLI